MSNADRDVFSLLPQRDARVLELRELYESSEFHAFLRRIEEQPEHIKSLPSMRVLESASLCLAESTSGDGLDNGLDRARKVLTEVLAIDWQDVRVLIDYAFFLDAYDSETERSHAIFELTIDILLRQFTETAVGLLNSLPYESKVNAGGDAVRHCASELKSKMDSALQKALSSPLRV